MKSVLQASITILLLLSCRAQACDRNFVDAVTKGIDPAYAASAGGTTLSAVRAIQACSGETKIYAAKVLARKLDPRYTSSVAQMMDSLVELCTHEKACAQTLVKEISRRIDPAYLRSTEYMAMAVYHVVDANRYDDVKCEAMQDLAEKIDANYAQSTFYLNVNILTISKIQTTPN